jgi:hypothetical protein
MLPAAARFKLDHEYRTPRFKIGATVTDEIRGKVKIVGISDARIPWPLSQHWTQRSVVVYGALERAIRRESVLAVAYWFGISVEKVRLVRRALGVPFHNDGTAHLRQRYAKTPGFRRMARKSWATAREREPTRGMLGRHHSKATRRKMSAAQRLRRAAERALAIRHRL